MKKSILALGLTVLVGSAMAQTNQLSVGADLAFPIGDFGKSYSFGIGPAAGLELPFGNHIGIIGQASYVFLFTQSDKSDFIRRARMIPLQAGIKYYLSENQRGLYVKGLAGVHSYSMTTEDIGPISGRTYSSSTFSWAVGLGLQLERLDLGARFNSITPEADAPGNPNSSRYLGLRVGYILAL